MATLPPGRIQERREVMPTLTYPPRHYTTAEPKRTTKRERPKILRSPGFDPRRLFICDNISVHGKIGVSIKNQRR